MAIAHVRRRRARCGVLVFAFRKSRLGRVPCVCVCAVRVRPGPHPGGAFQGAKRQRAFARPLEPHQPPRSANRTPLGCRDRKHPPLGCGLVVRHPDIGESGPHRAHAEASRWPILASMSALPATGAGRWARHGPRGPMGSVGSGLAPLGPARHLPGPTIGLRGASDGPFRPAGLSTRRVHEAAWAVWRLLGAGPCARGPR